MAFDSRKPRGVVDRALDRKQQFYVWLTAIFVAALITGDFIGGKFWVLFGFTPFRRASSRSR